MSQSEKGFDSLLPGARRLATLARQFQQDFGHPQLGSLHWLLALFERHGAMAESIVPGLEVKALLPSLRDQLNQGQWGEPLPLGELVAEAQAAAVAHGKARTGERDLAALILERSGYSGAEPKATGTLPAAGYPSRARRPTPMLEKFGRDLTREAIEGRLPPFVGREEELQLVIETLCRRTKRNPVLVGPAGVGKTAIVEGLAQRLAAQQVPALLAGARLLAVQPSTLVAGAGVVGELEQRLRALLEEAAQDGVLLFIDEVHSIIGSGGRGGTDDLASLLKPALARGEFACIAATTDDEYRRFIEPDAALERRFQPIRVQELTAEQTFGVLASVRDELARLRGVQVGDPVLRWLIDFAVQFLPNRRFPDKGVDLLEQCVAHAVARSRSTVELADAHAVAQRMVGMPIALPDRLQRLRSQLPVQVPLPAEELQVLLNRLNVTMRGLDLRPARPNAVFLFIERAVAAVEPLAASLAEALFGGADRVVSIDFGHLTSPADLTMLLGAPPGYVGYSETLPIHRLAQMPWCVLRCANLHACHPQIREVLAQALEVGFFTDARGKRIYLSDTVVLLDADVPVASQRSLGFANGQDDLRSGVEEAAISVLGARLFAQCDHFCATSGEAGGDGQRWLREQLLARLSERYRKLGLHLSWDESLLRWLADQREKSPRSTGVPNLRDWERLIDECLSPVLIEQLPTDEHERSLVVRWAQGRVRAEPLSLPPED